MQKNQTKPNQNKTLQQNPKLLEQPRVFKAEKQIVWISSLVNFWWITPHNPHPHFQGAGARHSPRAQPPIPSSAHIKRCSGSVCISARKELAAKSPLPSKLSVSLLTLQVEKRKRLKKKGKEKTEEKASGAPVPMK